MPTLTVDIKDRIAIITLDRPKVNAINRDMVEELLGTFAQLDESTLADGVILTGTGNCFSAGLDLIEVFDYNEEEVDRLWTSFHHVIQHMAGFTKPLIAAINGHAPAGGCVFALCCDHRVMADGNYRIGLNEVPVGLIMPKALTDLTVFTMGQRKAEDMLLNGTLMTAKEATDFGLIDDYCPQNEVLLWAQTRMKKWLTTHQDAWRGTKKALRTPLLKTLDTTINQGYGATIREWWSNDSRAILQKTITKIKAK